MILSYTNHHKGRKNHGNKKDEHYHWGLMGILSILLSLIGLTCLGTPAWTADAKQKISKSGISYRPDNGQARPEEAKKEEY